MSDHPPPNELIFLAALNGIMSNPLFFGATMQGDVNAAIDMARLTVRRSYKSPQDLSPDFIGKD